MPVLRCCIALTYLTLLLALPARAEVEILIEKPIYQHFTDTSSNPLNKNQRELVEIKMLLQALRLGGYSGDIRYYIIETAELVDRRKILREGRATVSATAWWTGVNADVSDHIYLSSPALTSQEVGLYTSLEKSKSLSVSSLEGLSALTATVDSRWLADINFLQSLNFKYLYRVSSWRNMLRMVESGRADIIVAAFSKSPDLSREHQGITLHPIPGAKLNFPHPRHWLISKANPAGQKTYQQIELGLSKLRQQGKIEQYYREAGVINAQVSDWRLLN